MDQNNKESGEMVATAQGGESSDNKDETKDIYAKWSFGLGLASIVFSWIGVIPLTALILGIIGIIKTKEPDTGRWMAIAGLILGVLFLLVNAQMNGHFLSPYEKCLNEVGQFEKWKCNNLR